MSEQITVTLGNNEQRQYPKGTSLLTISQDISAEFATPVVAAKVNNDFRDLQTIVETDCKVDFFDLYSDPGIKVYQRSLIFLLQAAAQDLFFDSKLAVTHSLNKGLYCEIDLGRELTAADVAALRQRMQEIAAENRPIVRKTLPIAEAIRLFELAGQMDKVKLLCQLRREIVSIYYCGEIYNYFYGHMVPSTGYLTVFDIKMYSPGSKGLLLRFPEKETPKALPKVVDQSKLAKIFREAERWGKILECEYVPTLNEWINRGKIRDLIWIAEALHEKKIAQIADFAAEHLREARLILVAGPSSSGKTTFAQRLNVQLRVNGIRPVPISLDDYFVDRDKTPTDEKGEYDFEALEAIDLELFNNHLMALLNGETIEAPNYNFLTGKREYRGRRMRIGKDQPLIIEGIHGLNDRLTSVVPREFKVKIYVSALTQLSIDSHNRIPTTDTRLIRRIVRDSQFRGHDALKTLKMWPAVRRGEERHIFPFQEEADMMFNSALIYELAVLKKLAEPLLTAVTNEHPEYSEARRLLNFLSYFQQVDDEEIFPHSILREFVGQSCFYK